MNFDWTMGFYWSYTLLLKPPVLMCSWCYYVKLGRIAYSLSVHLLGEVVQVPAIELFVFAQSASEGGGRWEGGDGREEMGREEMGREMRREEMGRKEIK